MKKFKNQKGNIMIIGIKLTKQKKYFTMEIEIL